MTVFLWDHQLTYLAVPKVACTSVKHAFFQIENGRPHEDFVANGQYFHIHRLYPTRLFKDLPQGRIASHQRLTLVRDPVHRLLSCYGDRVIYNRELSKKTAGPALEAVGLPTNPGLAEFIDRLADYRQIVPAIAHHAAPHVDFLGSDPSYFSEVFSMSRLQDFAEKVSARLKRPLCLEHYQAHGPKFSPSDLSPSQLATIRRHYEADYDIWGRYF